jgi:hypothetical protein
MLYICPARPYIWCGQLRQNSVYTWLSTQNRQRVSPPLTEQQVGDCVCFAVRRMQCNMY